MKLKGKIRPHQIILVAGVLISIALSPLLCSTGRELLASRPAADSGASATALSTGHKTEKGNIAWAAGDAADGQLTTMCEHVKKARQGACGLVSTVPFSHATPAPFAAHNVSRKNYLEISEEIVFEARPEVVIGGGHPHWSGGSPDGPKYKYLSEKAFDDVRSMESPYVYVERTVGTSGADALSLATQMAIEQDKKLFALFGGDDGFMDRFRAHGEAGAPTFLDRTRENPTLFEATAAALNVLTQNPNGFFLMVEGGDIDLANHDNNYRGMIEGMHNFERAVAQTMDSIESSHELNWDNTLLIVTSDHANSYMKFNRHKAPGRGILPKQLRRPGGLCANFDCGRFVYPDGEVEFAHGAHTNELVTLVAKGKGAATFGDLDTKYGNDIVDNTDIQRAIIAALTSVEAAHVILFIGDGMHEAHEVAYSRYMYGSDTALIWDDPTLFDFSGLATTWDIDTYNRYATEFDRPDFHPDSFDWTVGYDPTRGGTKPIVYSDERTEVMDEYFLTKLFSL